MSTMHSNPSFPRVFSGNSSLINRAGSKTGKADQAWILACAGMTNRKVR